MVRRMILIAAFGIISACQSIPNSSFCDVARPIRLSDATVDAMTDAEVNAALAHNEKLTKLCGVKP